MSDYYILDAVNEWGKRIPDLWDNMNMFHKINGDERVGRWHPFCYAPISAAIACLETTLSLSDAISNAGFVAALAAWRQTKYIYHFDEVLFSEIINISEDIVIPTEIIYQMPVSAIYVKFPDNLHVDGFLAAIESDPELDYNELRLYAVYDGYPIPLIVHLHHGQTISEGIEAGLQISKENMKDYPSADEFMSAIHNFHDLTIASVNLLLYICAENADIEEDEQQSKIYRRPNKIRDKFSEIRKYNAGTKQSVLLRKLRSKNTVNSKGKKGVIGTHASPIPHIRRAHYHHYWTGKRDGEKTLILRWIPPTIVGGKETDDIIPTVIEVEDK